VQLVLTLLVFWTVLFCINDMSSVQHVKKFAHTHTNYDIPNASLVSHFQFHLTNTLKDFTKCPECQSFFKALPIFLTSRHLKTSLGYCGVAPGVQQVVVHRPGSLGGLWNE